MDAAKKLVDEAIAGNAVVMFSKSYCPFCRKAKAAMSAAGANVAGFKGATIYELDEREDGSTIQQYLLEKTGVRTVPQVFVGGKFIGGGDDTDAMHREGKLATAITEALK